MTLNKHTCHFFSVQKIVKSGTLSVHVCCDMYENSGFRSGAYRVFLIDTIQGRVEQSCQPGVVLLYSWNFGICFVLF